MTKLLIETTGEFMLVDYTQGNLVIESDRPTVATRTDFVSGRSANGQLKVLANLDDEASDVEFAKYWVDSGKDSRLAIDSFLSAYGDQVEKTTRKPRTPKSPE